MKKILNIVLLGAGLALFYFFVVHTGIEEIGRVLKSANFYFCFAGISAFFGAAGARSRKWFFWLRTMRRDLKYGEILPFFLVNLFIGNFTPFKSGEGATPFFLKKFLKISAGKGFSIIILDRIFELAVFLLILTWAVFYLILRGLPHALVINFFLVLFSLLLLILFFLLTVVFFKKLTLKIVRRMEKIMMFRKLFQFFEQEILYLYDGINLTRREGVYLNIFFLTVLGWVFDFLAFYLVFLSVSRPYFFDLISSQTLSVAASFTTFVPNGIGIAEISVTSLLNLMGYPALQMAGAMVLVRIFLTGILVLSGLAGFYLIKEKKDTVV